MKKLNFIDLFAGAGGISCGLEMLGMKCLLGVEVDKHAAKTFAKNHRYAQTFCDDIRKLDAQTLKHLTHKKKIHVVVGGPPCQGFSTIGLGNPEDHRNILSMQFLRIVKETRPEFIMFENVTGILATKNWPILQGIIHRFGRLGYRIDVKVMAAHEYGVPEKRRRTIIVGRRGNAPIIFPERTHGDCDDLGAGLLPYVTVGEAFKDLKSSSGKIFNHDKSMAKIKSSLDLKRLKRIPEGKGIRYERDEKEYLTRSLCLNVDWKKLPEQRFRQTKYQRLHRDKPSPTIVTNRHMYYHPTEHRYLTVREAARLQSFPNDFEFLGTTTANWRQIGNAVPPLLAKCIGQSIVQMMKEQKGSEVRRRKPSMKKVVKEVREKAFLY